MMNVVASEMNNFYRYIPDAYDVSLLKRKKVGSSVGPTVILRKMAAY